MPPATTQRSSDRQTPPYVLTWVDGLLLLSFTAVLLTLCVVCSQSRLLWADELLGDRLLGSASFLGTMRGWWEGADGGGPVYYVLGRVWMALFGHTALSLRLYSAAGMSAGITLVWVAARRYFSVIGVAWSCAVVYLFAAAPRWQAVNGRFYGLIFAMAAWASLCFLMTADREPSRRDLVITAVAHALLIGSHILGFVYSFGLIVALILLDRSKKKFRPSLYLSAAAGSVVLVIAAHAIYRSTSIANGVFWTSKPARHEFLIGLSAGNPLILRAMCLLLLLSAAYLGFKHRVRSVLQALRLASPTWLCAALVLAQTIIFLKSQRGISIYADRYLMPLTVVTVFLLAASLDVLFSLRSSVRQGWLTLVTSLLVLVPASGYALRQRDLQQMYPLPGLPARITAPLPPGAHVLVTLLPDFTLLNKYDPSRTYYFLLDWPFDSRPNQGRSDYSGQREMENWRRAGYLSDRIIDCPRVFEQSPDLYILLDPGRQNWIDARLLHNPAFTAKPLGTYDEWDPYTLWFVHRVRPGPPPC